MSQNVTGIPANEILTVIKDFLDDGAATITIERQPDGTFNLSATF